MWGFIAFIILVAIIFGVSLHEAFWGIVAFAGVVCLVSLAFGTKIGREISKWVALGICCLMIFFGISNELQDGHFDLFSWSAIEAYIGIAGCCCLASLFNKDAETPAKKKS